MSGSGTHRAPGRLTTRLPVHLKRADLSLSSQKLIMEAEAEAESIRVNEPYSKGLKREDFLDSWLTAGMAVPLR